MVACDSDNCAREWFHLSCVDLTKLLGKNDMFRTLPVLLLLLQFLSGVVADMASVVSVSQRCGTAMSARSR